MSTYENFSRIKSDRLVKGVVLDKQRARQRKADQQGIGSQGR